MNSLWILIVTIFLLSSSYFIYGRFLSRLFGVDRSRPTPAQTRFDGVDFVPAKNWVVLFGHHFSAICGAGPIIGPALACAYWGWGPSLVWILAGCIFMGAVADFGSLMVSVRAEGNSIAEVARQEISRRARLLFSAFIWLSLVLVVAVFSIFTAKTFVEESDAVLPSLGLIPVAVFFGWLVYVRRMRGGAATMIGLGMLALLLIGGVRFPVSIPSFFGMSAETIWILILLLYCGIASVTPVQMLLQPRDYLASYILFASILMAIIGICVVQPVFQPDAFLGFKAGQLPGGTGLIWPMMFVTIACGAISGFHSIVSSGTTSKQIETEAHACRIGYGSMLVEGLVGVLTIICVAAGLSQIELRQIIGSGGPIVAFSHGYGVIAQPLLGEYGRPFAVLALNAFVLTTLDAATRITRYLTSELFGIQNKYLSTLIVVLSGGALALTGHWARLWPAFGASNQLIAGLALLVASCWLLHKGKSFWFTLVPSFFMLLTTIAAFLLQALDALTRRTNGQWSPDFFIAVISLLLIGLAAVVAYDAIRVIAKFMANRNAVARA